MYPKIKQGLEFFPFEGDCFHVYDPAASRHFKMGQQEVSWLRLLDGTRSLDDLKPHIAHEHFDDFFRHLGRMGLLEGANQKRKFDIFKLKFRLLRPNAWLDRVSGTAALYRQLLTIFFFPLAVLNGLLLALQWQPMQKALLSLHVGWQVVVSYLLTITIVGFIHEFSHAMVAKSRGANVPSIGLMLFYLQPAFFADISGIGFLRNRTHRIEALLAGIQANNVLITFSFFMFFLARGTGLEPYIALAIALNAILTIYNLIPFVEYDGYYVLLELIGEPQFGFNAKRMLFDRSFRKPEYVMYFAFSQLFSVSLVFGAVLAVRAFALQFTKSPLLDYAALAVMIVGYVLLSIRTARSLPVGARA